MILGIDTSNYTTSAAVLDGEVLTQQKQLLEVRPGERGLRQSDALFQHTRNLPLLFDKLPPMDGVTAVGVSTRPRNVEGSYMPCFLAGISAATAAAKAAGCPLYTTSHQVGHILAGTVRCRCAGDDPCALCGLSCVRRYNGSPACGTAQGRIDFRSLRGGQFGLKGRAAD